MDITKNNFGIIVISKGNDKLFKFHENTVLDYIYKDLWMDIMKYYTTPFFAIGIQGKSYVGHHEMTIAQFNENKKNIMNYCNNNETMHLLDEKCRGYWLSIERKHININKSHSYIGNPYMCTNTITFGYIAHIPHKIGEMYDIYADLDCLPMIELACLFIRELKN
jgi:hypothetical protein